MIVMDASVTGRILLPDEKALPHEIAAALTSGPLSAPSHWPTEVVNLLLSALRRRRLTPSQHWQAIEDAHVLRVIVSIESGQPFWRTVTELAVEHGLTAYDAAYLELTLRTGATLATGDGDLVEAARRAGVPVLDART